MEFSLAFLPELPWRVIAGLGALVAFGTAFALWRGLPGWALRGLALGLLVLALAGPQLKREEREGLNNVAFMVVDRSDSTGMEDRAAQIAAAAERLESDISSLSTPLDPLEIRVIEVAPDDSGENRGTRLLTALDEAAAHVATGQIAGAVLLTDGQIHDAGRQESFPAPVHALIAGRQDSFDLALEAVTTPGFGIVGETVEFQILARAHGPAAPEGALSVEVSVDGGAPQRQQLAPGGEGRIRVPVNHGGPNVVDIRLPAVQGELTTRNNRIIALHQFFRFVRLEA
jgi:hypothetical protein